MTSLKANANMAASPALARISIDAFSPLFVVY
jgi:hypothetical protein